MLWTSLHVLFGHLRIFGEMFVQLLSYLWIRLFYCWVIGVFYILWDIIHLSDIWLTNIFSCSVDCLFTLLIVSFDAQKFLILMKSNLSIFCCCYMCFWYHSKEITAKFDVVKIFPCSLSSTNFTVCVLKFRSLIHFVLNFVYDAQKGSSFILCMWIPIFFCTICWTDCPVPIE